MLDGLLKRVEIPSSTLQDVRLGRGLELNALTNAVVDIGRLTGDSGTGTWRGIGKSAECAGRWEAERR